MGTKRLGWKDFLEDYEAKEMENYRRFKKKIIDGKFGSEDTFPPTDRFPELRKPFSRLYHMGKFSAKNNIWAIIPLSGSTLHGLTPLPEAMFEETTGFPVKKIPEVVDFVKDTGKLQFVIRGYPTAFLDTQFLEPIFTELRPPLGVTFPLDILLGKRQLQRYMVEFDTLAKSKVAPSILGWSIETTGSTRNAELLLSNYRRVYACLKGLGYQRIVDELEYALVTHEGMAAMMMIVLGPLITEPFLDPLTCPSTLNADMYGFVVEFAKAHLLDVPEPSFPSEVGEFLLRKLVHCAPSLDACKQLTFEYEDMDVYKVAQALNQSIAENKPDAVRQGSEELSTVLENVWMDKRLANRIKEIKIGMPVLFGVVGALACGLTGGIGGLLAGLGFSVGDKLIGTMSGGIADKIAKLGAPNREVVVYDFKKKYNLNR